MVVAGAACVCMCVCVCVCVCVEGGVVCMCGCVCVGCLCLCVCVHPFLDKWRFAEGGLISVLGFRVVRFSLPYGVYNKKCKPG